jgi:Uma2 family endonuclease
MELGLFNPAHATPHDFRVPDITVYPLEAGTVRGTDGPAALAVEVRSPGDDSFKKLPFFDAMGVGEVLIVHRDSTWARHWVRGAGGRLIESEPADGSHQLRCVPLSIWSDGTGLFTEVDGTVSTL